MDLLPVVAVALTDAQGRVLIAQRPFDKEHGGLWEFPGGKIEPGESPEAALVRELREELGEAHAEIQRCKQIVSNILHSAGEARGEAMGSTDVAELLAGIAADWREGHSASSLAYADEGLQCARVATEPALRQAIWSLLENAFDVSPDAVSLTAERDGREVAICGRDEGPGFREDQLAKVGKLYQSTKGPGHGLGLFLAVNVARRLGGRLAAANLQPRGAEVRMVLPLVSESGEG